MGVVFKQIVRRSFKDRSSVLGEDEVSAVTIGKFDGLHLGHQSIISSLKNWKEKNPESSSIKVSLVSLYPHPAKVLKKNSSFNFSPVTPLRPKIHILNNLGVEIFCLLKFSKELSQLSAASFLDIFILRMLKAKFVVIGSDAAVGKDREGDATFIKKYLQERGCQCEIISTEVICKNPDDKVSSNQLRNLVEVGDFTSYRNLTGRDFYIVGRVIHGDKIARNLGFPTANLNYSNGILPPDGVYSCRVVFNMRRESSYKAVMHIGARPTYNSRVKRVEVHILDYDGGDFYSEALTVSFVTKIRDVVRFDSEDDLKAQIKLDIDSAIKSI